MTPRKAKTLRLLLGDQLHIGHSWFSKVDSETLYVMMEVRQETDYVRHHVQKVAAFFAAMRQFAEELRSRGHRVEYVRLEDQGNQQTLGHNLIELVRQTGAGSVEYQYPDEYRLDQQLAGIAHDIKCEVNAVDSEHFLTDRSFAARIFEGKKTWLMESFYRKLRKQYGILMDGDRPIGGKWNYDTENRRKYTGKVPIPAPVELHNDVSDIVEMMNRAEVDRFGEIEVSALKWPVNREQALAVLSHFVSYSLLHFGTYQDAMTIQSPFLFHSLLSFALNTKMLHPKEVIEAAVSAWEARPEAISLAQVEGFVRQILGWREYMRNVYWSHMPGFADMNYFDHDAPLPHYFWDAETEMNCLKQSLGQSLGLAYAHHIQRLMVIGNFALLAGLCPDEVDRWYLGVYVDAIEWVQLPNTRGMSQFADGGLTATKPYVSTANYIHKMSDYCKGCRYDRQKRHGDNACPFNSLHWHFYERHRNRLKSNPRIQTMYRVWERLERSERKATLSEAENYLKQIERL
jgi:deoxyribodipyrimidine photolyase-related protein